MLKNLKSLKSLFVVEEAKPDQKAAEESREQAAEPVRPEAFRPSSPAEPGKVQDKLFDVLFGALQANNQQGFDYLEFKDFVKSLASVPMDDATRFKSAFATAQTMGATKEVILKSANHYLDILAREEAKFQDALKGRKEADLTGQQGQIKDLEQLIRQKEADIEKLQKEIEAHRATIGQVEESINAASVKINQTAADFEATYQSLVGQIRADIQQIEQHL